MNKYKVLFITTSDLSGKSGHNIATNEIVEAFAVNPQIDLLLICPKPRSIFSDTIKSNAFHIEFFNVLVPPIPFNILPLNILVAHYLIYAKARKLLKNQKKISFMVARLGSFFFSPILIKKLKHIPYYLLIRGLSNFRGLYRIKLLNRFDLHMAENNIKLSENIYVAYDGIKSIITKYTEPQKIKIFNNAVNPSKFELLEKDKAKEILGLNFEKSDFVVGFVGSVQDRHHIKELIDAVENIYSTNKVVSTKKIKVLIVGDGPLLLKLKKHVCDSRYLPNKTVIFTGFVHHDKVSRYISACDVLYGVVSPTIASNPIKCYEYLAAERPIITTYIDDFRFVKNYNCGITLKSLDVEEVSDAILDYYNKSENELNKMGINGREYILNNHNWNNLPKEVINDFKSIS